MYFKEVKVLIEFGFRTLSRQDCLYNILHILSDEILKNDELCNKAFRLVEEKIFEEMWGEETIFKIQEIKVESDYLRIPSNEKRKYNLKERIRILFKGC